jgi:hypothetical protein
LKYINSRGKRVSRLPKKRKHKVTRARRNPSPIAFSPRGRGAQSPPVCPGCGLANPSDAHLLSCIKGKGKWGRNAASGVAKRSGMQITFGKRNPRGGMFLEYNWTAGTYYGRFGTTPTSIGGYHSFANLNEAKYVLKSVGLKLGKKTDTRTWRIETANVTEAKRNPYGGYIIIGKSRGATWYLSAMGGFTKHKRFADLFHSSATAQKKARSIVNRLPRQIEYIAVRKSA